MMFKAVSAAEQCDLVGVSLEGVRKVYGETMKYGTFHYNTVEVESGLKNSYAYKSGEGGGVMMMKYSQYRLGYSIGWLLEKQFLHPALCHHTTCPTPWNLSTKFNKSGIFVMGSW